MAQQLPSLNQETRGLKVFPLLTLLGWALIGFSIAIFIVVLSPVGAAYWGDHAKQVRDAAVAGDSLLTDLSALARWPSLLAPLIFSGVASFMVGIAMEFAAIPGILERRSAVLKQAIVLMGGQK